VPQTLCKLPSDVGTSVGGTWNSDGVSLFSDLAGIYRVPAAGGEPTRAYIGQALKALVMHEVGHTLGLRHNFKGSLQPPSVIDQTHCSVSWFTLSLMGPHNRPKLIATEGSSGKPITNGERRNQYHERAAQFLDRLSDARQKAEDLGKEVGSLFAAKD
jgi:hypothetical protein